MFSVISNVSIFLCVVLFIRKAELAPTFTETPLNPFYVLEDKNITLVWQYNLSGSFDDVVLQFIGDPTILTVVDKFEIDRDAAVPESIYKGRIEENINATRAEITIFALQRSESGGYEIELLNSNRQRARNRVTVQVQYPPEFNSVSDDVVTMEGEPSVTLECIADGEPAPNITWTKVYANGSDSGVLGTGNQFVREINRNNSGTYRCTAYNGIGIAPNRTVKVEVNFKPENIKLMVNDSVVCIGDVISITCSANGKPAVHTYQLFQNERPVNDGNSSAGVWIRKDLKEADFSYRCVANNTVGTAEKTVNVTVKVPSKVYPLENITVIEGGNRNLTCNVSGSPMPTITWTEVSSSSQSKGVVHYLTNISKNNAGEYKCEAINDCGNSSASTFLTVLYKPEKFKFTVSKSTGCQAFVVTFNCSADGNPPVDTYQLLENGVPVRNSSSSLAMWSRNISTVGAFDYKCMANNSVGTAYSMNVTVTLNVPSSITQITQDQNITEGHNVTLSCQVSGVPAPTVSWIKPGGQRHNGHMLEFTNINRSQDGEYKCEASNVCNNATETATIDVQYKPENVQLMSSAVDNKACKQEVISFNCSANADPGVTSYRLFENETAILSTSASGMWSKTLESEGVFVYKCVASNSLGSEYSMNVTVTVNVPSSITQITQDQNITEGHNVTLSCQVSGIPAPTVSWIKPGGQRHNGHMLEFTNINRSQAGEYKCEASNECSNVTETATIDVQYKPENVQLMSSAMNDKACKGEIISFNCSANANPGVTSYQLFENKTAILNTSATGTWSKTLESAGVFVYKCVANNSLGSEYSMDVPVTVNVPSSITQITQDQNVTEGHNVTLSCYVSGTPTPNVSWIKPGGQRHYVNMLEFTNINRSQAGEYKCEASNECSNATETATIDVQYKPGNVQLTTSVMDNKACKGDMIGFNCSAEANPSVTSYQLLENDTVILDANLSGMWKRNVLTGGLFMYKCVANNSLGSEVSSPVMITVNVPSNIESIQDQNVTEGDNLTLTCNASGMPQPNVSWIKPGGQRHNGHMLEVTNINRSQAGEYKCEASNECGNATETATIDVQYTPRITNISGEQSVNVDNVVTLFCVAEGNPAPKITWIKVADNSEVNFPLTIRGSQDEGLYRCTAENGVGSPVTKFVNMTVHFPAAIVAMGNHTVVKNETIELYCNVSGTPPPTVLWTRVKSGETWNQKKWTISDIQVEELGEYRCNASNKYGGDIKSTFILYEGGFCEKRCTDRKSCLKFGATYVCICPKGKTGEKCEKTDAPKKDFVVGLKLKGEFKQAYEDLENPETKTLVKKIEKNMIKEFNGTGLISVKVTKLRPGSIIADLELNFNNSVGESNVNALLTQAANKGKIGDMEVEEFSVGNNVPGPTTTSQPPEDCGTFFEGEDCKKATTVLWTKPAPSWTQTDSNDIRTVDIQVLKGSTHIHLSWNYTLSEGSDLKTTTFSINDGSSWNDIGVIYHADNDIVIYNKNNYRTRFNISDSNVATLILKKVTEDERAIFQCKLSTLSNSWTYSILVNFTKRHLNWVERPLSVVAVERHNLTLRWTYMKTLGLASLFRGAEFTNLSSREKTIAEKVLNTAPIVHTAYRPRFHVDYIQDTMASITIVGLKRSDRGRYRFDVKTLREDINELNTLSSIMELTVHYAASMANVSDHQTVLEGSYLQLLCQAFGNPTPNITWTKVLENSNDSKVLHHGTHWNLTKINRTASGLYNCTADNGIGNPVWRLIKVNVTYSAKVVKLASEHHVAVQGSVRLHCEAEGNPPPAYTWFPCDSKTQACHESTLTVSNALNDAVYSCNVANVLGNDTRETKVVTAGNVINVTLFISEQCPDENLSESVLWKNLEQKIEDLFKNEGYRSTELTNYRCGSVIVDLALKFNSSVKEEKVLSMLKDSAENGGLKELGVKASEIVGWRPGRPTEGPNSSTYGTKTTENASSAVPSELPAQSGDNQGLKDWMIAVIAGASGLVLLFVVIFLLCWISKTQKKKKGSGDEAVDMSTTSRYVKNGPHHSDKPSSSRESIEDDPFIAASTYSQNSVDRRDRKRDSSVNYGYQPDDSDQPQGEMLLKSGSRLPKNDRLTESTGELDVTSTYLARGPQRDCSTLPSYHRPPSYEEASKQKDRIMMTEPRPSTSTGGRQKRRKSPPEDRAEEASVAPSEMRSNQDGHRSDKDKGPLDPTAIYAMPDKKKKLDKQSPASLESVFDPFKAKDKSAKGPILHNPGNLDLDGPANASTSEGPRNLIIPIEMLPSNRQTPQKDDTENGKSEPSSPLNFTLEKRPRNSSSGVARYQPERSKLPYRNVRGELVRPDTLSRTSQDSHDIKPETLPNQSKPVGSQTHSRESSDASYITYVV